MLLHTINTEPLCVEYTAGLETETVSKLTHSPFSAVEVT